MVPGLGAVSGIVKTKGSGMGGLSARGLLGGMVLGVGKRI